MALHIYKIHFIRRRVIAQFYNATVCQLCQRRRHGHGTDIERVQQRLTLAESFTDLPQRK